MYHFHLKQQHLDHGMALSKNWLQGDVVEGTVKRLTDFGAFVEVLPGIDGLVHVSQISHKRIENPKKLLQLVKKLLLKFLMFNADAERVSISHQSS